MTNSEKRKIDLKDAIELIDSLIHKWAVDYSFWQEKKELYKQELKELNNGVNND